MKRLAWFDSRFNTVRVFTPNPSNKGADETEEEFLARCEARLDIPEGTTPTVVEDLPETPRNADGSRAYRNAWRLSGEKIEHDMEKCRELHLAQIRQARDAKLQALDTETIKAVGKGDTAERDRVEAEKQVLRDIPQTFDLSAAKNVAELAALWPPELER